eukprot:4987110-Prymnesium_polylepis.3
MPHFGAPVGAFAIQIWRLLAARSAQRARGMAPRSGSQWRVQRPSRSRERRRAVGTLRCRHRGRHATPTAARRSGGVQSPLTARTAGWGRPSCTLPGTVYIELHLV